ncbi:pyruvate kinase [Candidatus Uhrbacteria bacterium]|nr:pyruvate kinase [Candidatus Uhrbacteria bacterium]
MLRRTKIVCTIGPACEKETTLKTMMRAGMDVARLNFSHGTHAGHRELLRSVRRAADSAKKFVPIIGDLQGPKIRLGELPADGVTLKNSETYIFSTEIDEYKGSKIPITYKQLHKDVKVGHRFLIDDGLIELKIIKVIGKDIHAKVENGGTVTSHKGLNFPDSKLSVSSLTQKDRDDVEFAVQIGVEWIALSFVKTSADVRQLKKLIKKVVQAGQVTPRVIVKIEKYEAIEAFDEILNEADGVMIARGDLGIEIPAEEVPIRQKQLIEKCRAKGKPVIVATQMLDSMIRNPRPTRAEVSDVANAVFDHTDAVMLSGETASGKFPLAAVKTMATIVKEAEVSPFDDVVFDSPAVKDVVGSVAQAVKLAAEQQTIDGVLVSIELADWSETVLRFHPEIPLFIACPTQMQARQVSLRWGSETFVLKNVREKTFVARALRILKSDKKVHNGMRLAVVLGGRHGEAFDIITIA